MSEKFKAELVYLAPITVSLAIGTLFCLLIMMSPVVVMPVTPFPEGVGSFGNGLYFVVLVAFGAVLIYVLLKRKNLKIINTLTSFALILAVFMLSVVYLSAVLLRFDLPYMEAVVVVSSLPITAVGYYAIFKGHHRISTAAVLVLGGALGTFLGVAIPTLSAVLVLGFLAVYDAFAVYRGPVGKIARVGLDQLRGLSVSFRDIQMGLGDLTFYAMLSGHMLLNIGLASFLASFAGILSGCALSFKMLEKKGMFPGLPFPVFLGLTAGFLASLL